jgi:hypothetical protein
MRWLIRLTTLVMGAVVDGLPLALPIALLDVLIIVIKCFRFFNLDDV